jgi:hypothetical protein
MVIVDTVIDGLLKKGSRIDSHGNDADARRYREMCYLPNITPVKPPTPSITIPGILVRRW